MSRFRTEIPVDVDAVKRLLPTNSFVHGARLEGNKVVVEWESDKFKTGYTYPVEFPVATLKKRGCPEGVKLSAQS